MGPDEESEKPEREWPADQFSLTEEQLQEFKEGVAMLLRQSLLQMPPATLRSMAALLLGIERLPFITEGLDVCLSFSQQNLDGNYGWADISISEEEIRLSVGEHFYDPNVGGDTESHTLFESVAGTGEVHGNIQNWLELAAARSQDGRLVIDADETDYGSLDWGDDVE